MAHTGVRVTPATLADALLTDITPEWIRMGRDAMPWLVDGEAIVAVVGRNGWTTSGTDQR